MATRLMRLFVPMIGLTVLVMLAIAVSGTPGWPLLLCAALVWLAGTALLLRPLLRQSALSVSLPLPVSEDTLGMPDVVADRARDILNAVPDPLLLIGQGREIIWANQAAERQFGGRLTGRNLLAVLRHPPLLAAIEAIRQGRQPQADDESSLDAPLRLDIGHETEYQAVVVPLHAPAGTAPAVPGPCRGGPLPAAGFPNGTTPIQSSSYLHETPFPDTVVAPWSKKSVRRKNLCRNIVEECTRATSRTTCNTSRYLPAIRIPA